jgi:hypothetical protein
MAMISCVYCAKWCAVAWHYCPKCAKPLQVDDFQELVELEKEAEQERKKMPEDPLRNAVQTGFLYSFLPSIYAAQRLSYPFAGPATMLVLVLAIALLAFLRSKKSCRIFNEKYQPLWSRSYFQSSVQKL